MWYDKMSNNMEVVKMIQTILSRRSERDFTGEIIPQKDIKVMLECGFSAPSAMNRQPWSAVVIDKREILDKLIEVHPYVKMLEKASHAILICGDTLKSEIFWRDDCAAVTQNVLLAAHSLGYGACWCAVAPIEERVLAVRDLLQIPDTQQVYSLIAVGVKNTSKEPSEGRYQEELVHTNKW